jgi:DEAD/DEAH box helicase domain-containing protein
MLPLVIADHIRESLLDYVCTSFNFNDASVEEALLDALRNKKNGLYKGPWIDLRMPFRKAGKAENIPLDYRPSFPPYAHQLKAFRRLSCRLGNPQSTLVTTGTGSGKTECFLYPILDACVKTSPRRGIKAIVLYPMNALASDQAHRFAKEIHSNPEISHLRVGLYVGLEDDGNSAHRSMGPGNVIEHRETLRQHPPDILLTNYKMLDYLLRRPEDVPLWEHNLNSNVLQYLVLDELHTYDGAQGSEVAMLIRRLHARLGASFGSICPVGTSATIGGSGSDSSSDLCEFATQIFGVEFASDSVIFEERIKFEEYFKDSDRIEYNTWPEGEPGEFLPKRGETPENYLERVVFKWCQRPRFHKAITMCSRMFSACRSSRFWRAYSYRFAMRSCCSH